MRRHWEVAPGICALVGALALTLVGSCATLENGHPKEWSEFLPPSSHGALAEVSRDFERRHGSGKSGFLLLDEAAEAFLWRLALIDHAKDAIDIQAFMWKDDEVGQLFLRRLIAASKRGVRVRILIDDLVLETADKEIAALSRLPNFEFRVFNPVYLRIGPLASAVEYAFYFEELNRRMHNKLFVVDGHMAVVGGRNIADEYFGLNKRYNFLDLDVLACGRVVSGISKAFDVYWNSGPAFPARAFRNGVGDERLDRLLAKLEREHRKHWPKLSASQYPVEVKDWTEQLDGLASALHPGTAQFVQDVPEPTGDPADVKLIHQIRAHTKPVRKELLIATPYLIPVGSMLEDFRTLSQKGVKVTVLTGAMESTTHTIVNSHYKKYRRPILDCGVRLRELKRHPSAETRALTDVDPVMAKFASLHIKAMVSDRETCYIGSLNLDPRGLVINTENGLVIESPGLSRELALLLEEVCEPENAWRVFLNERGRIRWESDEGTRSIQPARYLGQRLGDFFLRFVPVENQL